MKSLASFDEFNVSRFGDPYAKRYDFTVWLVKKIEEKEEKEEKNKEDEKTEIKIVERYPGGSSLQETKLLAGVYAQLEEIKYVIHRV